MKETEDLSFEREVMQFLDTLKYVCLPTDQEIIRILAGKVGNDMRAAMNLTEVPEEMHRDYIMAVAGELLLMRKGSGQLDIETLDFDGVQSVSEGDTSVTFSGSESDETKFNQLMSYLLGWKWKIGRFRRIAW